MSGYQMPDGSIHEFASDAEASTALNAWNVQFGKNRLGEPTQKEESTYDYVVNSAKRGLATVPTLASMAGDVVNAPLKYVGKQVSDIFGLGYKPDYLQNTKAISNSAPDVIGYDPQMPIPKDAYGNPKLSADMLGHLAEFATGNILPGGAVVASARRPLVALAKEIAGVGLAAEGATMGANIVPEEHRAAGEFLGSLTGPLLAQKLITNATKGGNWVSSASEKAGFFGLSDEAKRMAGTVKAAKELQPQLSSAVSQQNMNEVGMLARKIPDFKTNITLGQATGSPVIQSMQQHYGTTVPDAMNLAQTKQSGLLSSIDKYTEGRFPLEPNISPIQGAKQAYGEKIATLDAGITRLNNQETFLASQFPRGDMEVIGAKIRDVRDSLMSATKQAVNARYKAVYDAANKSGLKVDMSDAEVLAASINRDSGRVFQNDPGVIGKILSRYGRNETKPVPTFKITPTGAKIRQPDAPLNQPNTIVPFEEFHSLYKDANREASVLNIAAKMGDKDAPQKLQQVEAVRDLLKTKLTQMEGPSAGNVGALLKDANQFYNSKYRMLFKTGVGGEIGKMGKFGFSTEDAKIVPSLIFKQGDASGVKEYLAMAQGDVSAYRALESGVMDKFSKEVVKDAANGKIDQASINRFLTKYKEPLAELPGIRAKLTNADSAIRSINQNRQMVIDEQRAFANSAIARIAKTENPEAAINHAMNSPNTMAQLLAKSSPVERKAIARTIMESVIKQPDPLAFMAKNSVVLNSALGKKQIGYLETIIAARKIASRTEAPTHLTFEKLNDPLSKAIGTSIPQAISEQKGVAMRFASPLYAGSRVGMRWFNKLSNEQRDKVLMDAIYNPEMAMDLSKYLVSPTKSAADAMNPHMIPYLMRGAIEGEKAIKEQQQ